MNKDVKRLIAERDRLTADIETGKQRLVGLNYAIETLTGGSPAPMNGATGGVSGKGRRKGVKSSVMSLIEDAGSDGITVADIIEKSNGTLERQSVASMLSSLKRAGILEHEDNKYRKAANAPAPKPRGRKKKAEK